MSLFIAIGSTLLAIVYLLKFVLIPDDGTLAVFAIHLFIAVTAWAIFAVGRKIQ